MVLSLEPNGRQVDKCLVLLYDKQMNIPSLALAGSLLLNACAKEETCTYYPEVENLNASGGKKILAVLAENVESAPGFGFTSEEVTEALSEGSTYWSESSEGQMWISDAKVVGPYFTSELIQTNEAKNQLLEQVEDHDQVDFSDYDYVYYFHKTLTDAQYGYAEMSDYKTSTGENLVMPSVLVTLQDAGYMPLISAHEGLHYWLGHANFFDCGADTLTQNSDDCERVAYQNLTSYMGFGMDKELDLTQRLSIGWLAADELLQVKESGTYSITPRYQGTPLTSEGAQVQRWADSGEVLSSFQVEWDPSYSAGLMFTMVDKTPIACDPENPLREGNQNSNLLDMQPEEEEYEDPSEKFTLNPGAEFVDPVTGMTIGGVEIQNGKIYFEVTYK